MLTESGVLNTEATLYLEGAELEDVPCYAEYRGGLRFAFMNEREGEKGHAVVHTNSLKARNRTEASDSLVNRREMLEDGLEDKGFTSMILDALARGRSPFQLCKALHLHDHPSITSQGKLNRWDPIYRKVIYRNDPLSLYRRKLAIRVNRHDQLPPPPPPPQPPPPGADLPDGVWNNPLGGAETPLAGCGPPTPMHSPAASAAATPQALDRSEHDAQADFFFGMDDLGAVAPSAGELAAQVEVDVTVLDVASPAIPNGISNYGRLRQKYALSFFHERLKELEVLPERFMYSITLETQGSLARLLPLLAPSLETEYAAGSVLNLWSGEAEHATNLSADRGNLDEVMGALLKRNLWFSVVECNPAARRPASKGKLSRDKIGIAIHKPRIVNVASKTVSVWGHTNQLRIRWRWRRRAARYSIGPRHQCAK